MVEASWGLSFSFVVFSGELIIISPFFYSSIPILLFLGFLDRFGVYINVKRLVAEYDLM